MIVKIMAIKNINVEQILCQYRFISGIVTLIFVGL